MAKIASKEEVRRKIVARAPLPVRLKPGDIKFEASRWMSYLDEADAVLKELDQDAETKGSA